MAKYRCARCGTEREDLADVVWTEKGWLCAYCQDSEYIEELERAGEPNARQIVAQMRSDMER